MDLTYAAIATTFKATNRAEQGNNQAGLHHLYANRSLYENQLDMQIDAASSFFLQLWTCTGPTFRLRDRGPYEYCHEKEYDPLARVGMSRDGRQLNFTAMDGSVQRPFLLHSNGYHWVMRRSNFRPLLDQYVHSSHKNLNSISALKPSMSALMDYPVLLLDTYDHGACNLTTLGWLLNSTHWPEGAPHL